jgi:K+-sensing histidine kinase KdpD
MSARVRQVAWVAAALVVAVALSAALLPLRYNVDDVLVAVVLLAVSAAVLARAEWLPRLVAGVSAALSFNFFYTQPYDQFGGGGVQGFETTVVLGVAIPALAAWVGKLSGQEAARERALREQAERNAADLAERQRQVERLAADLTASRRRIVAAGDETRRRIERNLHDGVQQRLVTVSLKLGGIRDRVPDSLPAIRDDLDQLADVLIETLDEIRDLARGVHPAILAEARGRLRVYLGVAPGAGATCALLSEGHRRAEQGADVVVAGVQARGRPVTAGMLTGLEIVRPATAESPGAATGDMDFGAVLARRPEVALVDELAHSNLPGLGYACRWQDVAELLASGIDVVTTVSVGHLDSLAGSDPGSSAAPAEPTCISSPTRQTLPAGRAANTTSVRY